MSNEQKPFLDMANAISALRFELPEPVWKDVAKKWANFVSTISKPEPPPVQSPNEDEIERLKELIEKLYKSTGNRIMANMFDDNIDITWQQFKTEHNL